MGDTWCCMSSKWLKGLKGWSERLLKLWKAAAHWGDKSMWGVSYERLESKRYQNSTTGGYWVVRGRPFMVYKGMAEQYLKEGTGDSIQKNRKRKENLLLRALLLWPSLAGYNVDKTHYILGNEGNVVSDKTHYTWQWWQCCFITYRHVALPGEGKHAEECSIQVARILVALDASILAKHCLDVVVGRKWSYTSSNRLTIHTSECWRKRCIQYIVVLVFKIVNTRSFLNQSKLV